MGYFYFDETIRDNGNFIIGVFIYSNRDLTPEIFSALKEVGLNPEIDEFKSNSLKISNTQQQKLRNSLDTLLTYCQTGLLVTPIEQRANLGNNSLKCLLKIIQSNELNKQNHDVYFDQGIKIKDAEKLSFNKKSGGICTLHLNQDSKIIGGIQIADLVAHYLGSMLLEEMGLLSKQVKTGDNSGYNTDNMVELGFELWTKLRYSFFKSSNPIGATSDDPISEIVFDVENYGLYISSLCSYSLRDSAINCFGKCYMGCIH